MLSFSGFGMIFYLMICICYATRDEFRMQPHWGKLEFRALYLKQFDPVIKDSLLKNRFFMEISP